MRFNAFLGGVAALTAAAGASARYLADAPPATTLNPLLAERQAVPTASFSRTTLTPDPWQCVAENITQYFDGPTPTGNVLDAINSYGGEMNEDCYSTKSGYERLSCTISDPAVWCGITTAMPPDVLSSYSTFVSDVVAFWTAKSDKVSVLSTSCPVAWGRFHMANKEWLRIFAAHANCHLGLAGHPQTQVEGQTEALTEITAPTATGGEAAASTTATTTTSGAGALRRGRTVEVMAWMAAGLFLLLAIKT